MEQKFIDEYQEYLNRWRNIRNNGSDEWVAVYSKDGQPILEKRDQYSCPHSCSCNRH